MVGLGFAGDARCGGVGGDGLVNEAHCANNAVMTDFDVLTGEDG